VKRFYMMYGQLAYLNFDDMIPSDKTRLSIVLKGIFSKERFV